MTPFTVDWVIAEQSMAEIRLACRSQPSELIRFHDAVEIANRELSLRPLEWGEAKYDLKFIRATVCVGFANRISFDYGVWHAARIVRVRKVTDQTHA